MTKLKFLSLIALVAILGCTTGLSKDMQLMNQGYEALNQGDLVEAEKYLNESLEVNPENPYALLNLGVVYMNTNREIMAKQTFRKLVDLNPPDRAGTSTESGKVGKRLVDIAKDNLKLLE